LPVKQDGRDAAAFFCVTKPQPSLGLNCKFKHSDGGSGAVLATLHTYSNLNRGTGYAQRSFSLSPYAGQTITLKFTGSEDYELQTSFVIDDTAINVN